MYSQRYLEVKKYPNASLKITNLQLPINFIQIKSPQKVSFNGLLNVHGVINPIKGEAQISVNSDNMMVIAKTKTTLDAHKIKTPGYMGITVADLVKIQVKFDAKLIKEAKKD